MICADTNFIIDILKNKVGATKKLKEVEDEQIAITVITIFELYYGIFKVKGINLQKRISQLQKVINRLVIFPLTHESAILAAKNLGKLSQEGKLISTLDCFIASISISHGCNKLITRNIVHFENIEGLHIIVY
ncbi:MAG: type II toxin-antitoxin system VapC family toxin [Candidatus Helarchaeota archaeon]